MKSKQVYLLCTNQAMNRSFMSAEQTLFLILLFSELNMAPLTAYECLCYIHLLLLLKGGIVGVTVSSTTVETFHIEISVQCLLVQ